MEPDLEVPTVGILTDTSRWIMVHYDHSQNVLRTSVVNYVCLPAGAKDDQLKTQVLPILPILSAILKEQADAWEKVLR